VLCNIVGDGWKGEQEILKSIEPWVDFYPFEFLEVMIFIN
jgi:hypothetical protein